MLTRIFKAQQTYLCGTLGPVVCHTHEDAWRFCLWLSKLRAISLPKELCVCGGVVALTPDTLTPGSHRPERLAPTSERASQFCSEAPQRLDSPHHTRWVNFYQLARAMVLSTLGKHDPGPDTPFRFNQPRTAGGPQVPKSGEIMGKASGNLGYIPLLHSAKCADGILWRVEMCLFGPLARVVQVWAPCRS